MFSPKLDLIENKPGKWIRLRWASSFIYVWYILYL